MLDAFRSYIYEAEVTASGEGISVSADREENLDSRNPLYTVEVREDLQEQY